VTRDGLDGQGPHRGAGHRWLHARNRHGLSHQGAALLTDRGADLESLSGDLPVVAGEGAGGEKGRLVAHKPSGGEEPDATAGAL
jgi:hypothetical protein